jgi:lysozyme
MRYMLRDGDRGQEVKRLQLNLDISADGIFGPQTESAVRDYQRSQDLGVDGIAGPLTLGALGIEVFYGVDLSSHNGTVDFSLLARSGCKYAWIKLTEGTTHTNPGFEEKYKGCRDNGIIVGGYHFGRPDTYPNDSSDVANEMDNFLSALNKVGLDCGDLVPMLNLEAGVKTGDQYNVDWALQWSELLSCKERVRPIIYTAKWYYDAYLRDASEESLDELANYPLWVASYNDGASPSRMVKSWKTWDVWQFTGSGSAAGVTGKCDQNWMAGGQLRQLQVP